LISLVRIASPESAVTATGIFSRSSGRRRAVTTTSSIAVCCAGFTFAGAVEACCVAVCAKAGAAKTHAKAVALNARIAIFLLIFPSCDTDPSDPGVPAPDSIGAIFCYLVSIPRFVARQSGSGAGVALLPLLLPSGTRPGRRSVNR
jgi:hypothetical protein